MELEKAASLLNEKLRYVKDFVSICTINMDTKKSIVVFSKNILSKNFDFVRNDGWLGFPVEIREMKQPYFLRNNIMKTIAIV